MTIRILADREPYCSYAESPWPDGAETGQGDYVVLNGPPRLDEPSPDFIVLPAEDYLSLPRPLVTAPYRGIAYLAYGSIDLMETAFERGCADYLREPWTPSELFARIHRLAKKKFFIEGRPFELKGTCLVGDKGFVDLSESERRLLEILLKSAPFPVPRDVAEAALLRRVPGGRKDLGPCVISLRRKMERVESGLSSRLRAVRGFGYRLEADPCG